MSEKKNRRFGKERQCCRYIYSVHAIHIARMIFRGPLCPQLIKLNGLIRYAFSRPDQVDIWIQVCLHILWNEQTDHNLCC